MTALRIEMVTFDCLDPAALARWWAEQFGGTDEAMVDGEFAVVNRPAGPRLAFQRVPDPTPGKNRVHLDFHTDDMEAEVARLAAAGATEVGRHSMDEFRWTVMTDPEGNVFCVAAD